MWFWVPPMDLPPRLPVRPRHATTERSVLEKAAPPAEAEEDSGWAPQVAWAQEAPAPQLASRDVPSPHLPPAQPAPATPTAPAAPAAGQTFAPQTFTPQTSFTPEPAGSGAFDDQVTNMLAQRADLAQQALAELSQLSSYRPKVDNAASTLVRRTPGTIPAAPAIITKPAGEQVKRDASQVRSVISSFQSGTQRGRQANDAATDPGTTQNSDGAAGPAGQDGQDDGLQPVPAPAPDTQRSTSW